MCGIFGFSIPQGAVKDWQRGVLVTNLARLNDDRGGHSWGMVCGEEITRGLGNLYPEAGPMAEHETAWAHTRLATEGNITVPNSHPFELGSITGAHNGMIWNHYALNQKYQRDHDVDSMHIFSHLDAGLPFDELRGYGAIEWTDRRHPGKIFLCRLDGGELCVAGLGTAEGCQGIVWSSDEDHLQEVLAACGLGYFEFATEAGVVLTVANHDLYAEGLQLNLQEPQPVTTRAAGPMGGLNHWSGAEDEDAWRKRAREIFREHRKASATDKGTSLNTETDPWEEYQDGAEEEALLASMGLSAADDIPSTEATDWTEADRDEYLRWWRDNHVTQNDAE